MKKGDIVTGVIERVSFPNKGVMKTEEGVVIVKNTLPGQVVSARIDKKKNGKASGRLLEVVEKSPLECEAPCPHFGICGGCSYLSLPYEEEAQLKEDQVKRLLMQALQEVGDEERLNDTSWWEPIKKPQPCLGYRNKMEFSFGDEVKGGPLSLGMHKRGSFYDIVTVTDCQIVDEDYRTIVRGVRDYFGAFYEKGEISFYHRLSHEGYLRHLLVRKALHTGEILVDLVTTSQEQQDMEAFKDMLLSLPLKGTMTGILHTTNDSLADVVQDDGTEILFGSESFTEQLLGLSFQITPFSFFQTNSYGAEVLYDTARSYIRDTGALSGNGEDGPIVFDLYSGTGTIAQLMCQAAKKVIGVEIVEEAVEAAKINAERNGLTNCSFMAGDVLKVIDEIEEQPDFIILDPPRDGIHPKALPKILQYNVPYILYISCKPTSLARDLAGMYQGGYRLMKAVCVEEFPFTSGVETIALWKREE